MPATKEHIRQIIADNNLSSVADVYTLLRDSFQDILQELMEAELDASFGYEKIRKKRSRHPIRETGTSLKHEKASMESSRSMSRETVRVSLSQS